MKLKNRKKGLLITVDGPVELENQQQLKL